MMNDILYEVVKAVVIVAVMAFVRYFIPFAKTTVEHSKYKWVADLVESAVKAAEQQIAESHAGESKKSLAVAFVKGVLAENHVSISDEQIDALIEAAVYAMNEKKA